MKNLDSVIAVFEKSDDFIVVLDCALNTLWTNKPEMSVVLPNSFSKIASVKPAAKLSRRFKPVYSVGRGLALKVMPIYDGSLVEGYLLKYYNSDEIQRLAGNLKDYTYEETYFSNVRNCLLNIYNVVNECKLSAESGEAYDVEKKLADISEDVRRSLASTVNYEELLKYRAKPFKSTPINISRCMEKLLAWVAEKFEAVGARLVYEVEPTLLYSTDWSHLEAAVLNLIINGYMYSNAEEKEVRVYVRSDGYTLRIRVDDNGTAADLQTVNKYAFEEEYSEIQGSREYLGLNLVNNFVKLSNGWLYLGLTEKGGLTAVIDLPADKFITKNGGSLTLLKRGDVYFEMGENNTRILAKANL